MNIERIKNILNKDNRVTFKLCSLEYAIEIADNQIRIYSLTYPDNIKFCSTLDELLNNFRAYNENISELKEMIIIYE